MPFSCTITPRCLDAWSSACEPVTKGQLWSLETVQAMHAQALSQGVTLAELLALSEVASASSSPCFDHPVSDRPDQWDSTVSNPHTVTVDTEFDPKDPLNHTSLRNLSEQDRQKLTNEHRKSASSAKEPADLTGLVNAVSFSMFLTRRVLLKSAPHFPTDPSSASGRGQVSKGRIYLG